MSASALPPMTADQFIAWSLDQPKGPRHELEGGVILTMESERVAHVRAKQTIYRRLSDALAGLPCEAFIDGLAVQIDDKTVYEPDVLLRCGSRLAGDITRIVDPTVVVEVRSPSSQYRDAVVKLAGYFSLASLRHYLLVAPDLRTVIHHGRDEAGTILTRIVRDGPAALDPPGIVIDDLFPDEEER